MPRPDRAPPARADESGREAGGSRGRPPEAYRRGRRCCRRCRCRRRPKAAGNEEHKSGEAENGCTNVCLPCGAAAEAGDEGSAREREGGGGSGGVDGAVQGKVWGGMYLLEGPSSPTLCAQNLRLYF